ncbi:MAG: hypothetical protein A4E24_01706 [Methanomethylovorans sp. PtaU1.Bin093]|uniref:DUF5788 family protein n=1 Tax=Methanomethylovorans sp. PtaU1.Bin093 TaxID=1811679 RepID=UPI0009D4C73B|nr:DUF5788 family protein [Methanomethylovorans sp. PtaU1.Bin093]OPY19355.1 MAG: hypothetical protein A4E24_01706 [Methanomethylovorans sp. PtaU1.Bin093]
MDNDKGKEKSDRLITERERKQLLAELHTRLFWVGEKIPYVVEIKGRSCKLHDRIWDLINREYISEEEKQEIEKCIALLKDKERIDELELETKEMTLEEAKKLSDETAGLLRAIMDLREIEEGVSKEKEKKFHELFSAQRTEEIRRWLNFLKDAGKI